jgi:hypothetical protein
VGFQAMRKMQYNFFGLLTLLVAVISLMVVLGAAGQTVSAAALPGMTAQEYAMQPSSGPGIPAIRPTQAGVPAFTEADVRVFLTITSGFPGGLTLSGSKPVITQIVFITNKQLRDIRPNRHVGLPDTAIICYVQFQGPFSGNNHSLPHGARPGIFQKGDMVFDARTGNLLSWSEW